MQGVGCRVKGAGFRVQNAGCIVQGAWCRVQGVGYRAYERGGVVARDSGEHAPTIQPASRA